MARNSRHKSHMSDKHELQEEGGSRDRSRREEDSGTRVSRDPKTELGKKRKGRDDDDSIATDRRVGALKDDANVTKGPRSEAYRADETEKSGKARPSAGDRHERTSRRRDGAVERHEGRAGKTEPGKQKLEKDSSRGDGSGRYKDADERDRERRPEKERSNPESNRNQGAKTVSSKTEDMAKKDNENTVSEWNLQEELRNPELEKELDKRMRRRDVSGDKDKHVSDRKSNYRQCRDTVSRWNRESEDMWYKENEVKQYKGSKDRRYKETEDRRYKVSEGRRYKESEDRRYKESEDRQCKESEDRNISLRDDHEKNCSYIDEKHKADRSRDGYGRDKCLEDVDREHGNRDETQLDERSLRDHAGDPYDGKHIKDDKPSQSRSKRSKLDDSRIHDSGPYVEDHAPKFEAIKVRKRPHDGNEYHKDVKLQNVKQRHVDVERNASSTCKSIQVDITRSEYLHHNKHEPSFSENWSKNSPSSTARACEDLIRSSLKLVETTSRLPLSEGRSCSSSVSAVGHASVPEEHDRSWDKIRPGDHVNSSEFVNSIPSSGGNISPNKRTEKSPSTSDRHNSNKSGSRRAHDSESLRQMHNRHKDVCSYIEGRDNVDSYSQIGILAGHFSGRSAGGGKCPPSCIRPRVGSPSVSDSLEDDTRNESGYHKPQIYYRRIDHNTGRTWGNAWRSTSPWNPVANSFVPLQHGWPRPGFHPAMQQYPPSPLYGVRPLDINQTGVSYHMHEVADMFSGPDHSFGCHNTLGSSQLQGWNSNAFFSGESRTYGRLEWDQNRHLIENRQWERNASLQKDQNGDVSMVFSVPKETEDAAGLEDDAYTRQSENGSQIELGCEECVPDEKPDFGRVSDTSSLKRTVEILPKITDEKIDKITKASEDPSDDSARVCCTYLSKLDISPSLISLELSKQCMIILGGIGLPGDVGCAEYGHRQTAKRGAKAAAEPSNDILESYPPKRTYDILQTIIEEAKAASKSSSYILSSVIPKTKEDASKRAMSIYKQQQMFKIAEVPVLTILEKEENTVEASAPQKLSPVECNKTSEGNSQKNAEPVLDDKELHNIGNAEANVPNFICDTVFVDSQACEAKFQECSFSRIHISPESTH